MEGEATDTDTNILHLSGSSLHQQANETAATDISSDTLGIPILKSQHVPQSSARYCDSRIEHENADKDGDEDGDHTSQNEK